MNRVGKCILALGFAAATVAGLTYLSKLAIEAGAQKEEEQSEREMFGDNEE